jgi:hypothetical protein
MNEENIAKINNKDVRQSLKQVKQTIMIQQGHQTQEQNSKIDDSEIA